MANTTGKKYGGREKGTPNKLTKEMRVVLKNVVHNEIENLNEHFKSLETIDRINLLLKLIPYVLPKVRDINHDFNEPIDFGF